MHELARQESIAVYLPPNLYADIIEGMERQFRALPCVHEIITIISDEVTCCIVCFTTRWPSRQKLGTLSEIELYLDKLEKQLKHVT